jgi:hypothetical protein
MFQPYQHFRRPPPLSLHQVLAELRSPPLKALSLTDALHFLIYESPRFHC